MDRIVVLNFGGQYSHLIARRVRELGVYAEVLPGDTPAKNLKEIKGIILSGGASSVYDKTSPKCDKKIFELNVPVLGICYGHQLIAYLNGGSVVKSKIGEYGTTKLFLRKKSMLLNGMKKNGKVWMNHQDVVKKLPKGFSVIAQTDASPIAAFENKQKKLYGVQFHPEVTHTLYGKKILSNFLFNICKVRKNWRYGNVTKELIKEVKEKIGKRRAIIAVSGGVDSSTAAVIVNKAIGNRLIAVYIDSGLMRENDKKSVEKIFSKYKLKLKVVDAKRKFFKSLKGVTDPEEKRKIIGRLFIEIFEKVAKKEKAEVLVQGTIYSDRIESGMTKFSSRIKSHHNVGGVPNKLNLEIYEPLRNLYKDEVRKIAKKIGLPKELIEKHVFPGPGFAIRIIGEVTPKKVEIVRQATSIVEEELKKSGWYEKVWMGFAVLLPIKTVGIQGDRRTYRYPVVVRIIESKDAMTANFTKLPYGLLERISTRITNEIQEVNRVVYDVSNKPPATMEWE